MSDQIRDKVRDMAKLALAADRISEVQAYNLKAFPLVFFNGISEASVEYDFSHDKPVEYEENVKDGEIKYHLGKPTKKNFEVIYRLTLDESQNDNLDKRYQALESAVRTLFFKETLTRIYFNGRLVYGDPK